MKEDMKDKNEYKKQEIVRKNCYKCDLETIIINDS